MCKKVKPALAGKPARKKREGKFAGNTPVVQGFRGGAKPAKPVLPPPDSIGFGERGHLARSGRHLAGQPARAPGQRSNPGNNTPPDVGWRPYKPSRIRSRSSTSARTATDTAPHRLSSLSLLTLRMASHMRYELFFRPPSGGTTATCHGMPRAVEVSGITTASPALLSLNAPTDTTRTGRRPACSRPRVGSRSASQISPR